MIGPDAGTRVRFTRDGWEARRADFDLALATILAGIRAGRFFQRPGICAARGPCAFDLACGAERGRWADAKRADPAIAAHEILDGDRVTSPAVTARLTSDRSHRPAGAS